MSYVTRGKINPKFAANRAPISVDALQLQFRAVEGLELKLIRSASGNRLKHGWPWTYGLHNPDQVVGLLRRLNRYQEYVGEQFRILIANDHGVIFNIDDLRTLAEAKTTIQQLKDRKP
jgi:hypothetical protein